MLIRLWGDLLGRELSWKAAGMRVRRLLEISLILFAAVCHGDDLPRGVVDTQNPADVSLTPAESLARISVPDGFHVSLFAGEPDLRRPIAFDFDDRGRVWVVENYSHPKWKEDGNSDRVIILEDTNHDGEFDKRTVFWDKGRYLTGIAIGHGGIWLANTPELTFIPDRNRDDVPDAEPQAMLDGFQISTNNVVNNLHWGPDGWLYGAIGLSSKSLVGQPGANVDHRTQITRGMWRYHPVRQVFEKIAEGMVNPWGADFNEFGDLITANTVLAHLWHIVPGMYCERRASERDNPFAYARIQTIANHLHWGGGAWAESRNPSSRKDTKGQPQAAEELDHDDEEYHQHSVAGGGHAHCGGMIYLGDNWPDEHRGAFFTNNLHGNRVNCDKLEAKRSTYVGIHADDLLLGNDPWFRGMSIKYGPDGGVYVSDWHDFGECHDGDGSHRSSGRLYKVVYGQPTGQPFDLQTMTNSQLVNLHLHKNDWFVRHARRILHERSLAGVDLADAEQALWNILNDDDQVTNKLKAMWTLSVTGGLARPQLEALLVHDSEHIRRWAVRLIFDEAPCDMGSGARQALFANSETAKLLQAMAGAETSAKVRLEIACCLQRMSHSDRLVLAEGLVGHAADATDPYIPLMIWYGLEPALQQAPATAIDLAQASEIPLVRQFIARRLVDARQPLSDEIVAAALLAVDDAAVLDFLKGMLEGLAGKGSRTVSPQWAKLYQRVQRSSNSELRSVAVQLAMIFGDTQAIAGLRTNLHDTQASEGDRKSALQSLLQLTDRVSVGDLHQLIQQGDWLRTDAIKALAIRNEPSTVEVLLAAYPNLNQSERQAAVAVLVTRLTFAEQLVAAIERGDIERTDVSAFALQQLRAFGNADLQQKVSQIWADDATGLAKAEEIARLKSVMSSEYLAEGSAASGRLLFERTCSKCHRLYGEGGTIAPDLTGSGRKKTDYVLRNLIDPSAEIDEAYKLTTVVTADGRLLSGFIVKQDDRWLEIRTQDAEVRLDMKDVDEIVTSKVSMMPEGMLRNLSDQDFRDLLTYLATDEQVELPVELE